MATLENLTPGQIVYSVTSERAGNTTIRRQSIKQIKIVSVDLDARTAVVTSQTGTRTVSDADVRRWKVKKPMRKPDILDRAAAIATAARAAGLAYSAQGAIDQAKSDVARKDER